MKRYDTELSHGDYVIKEFKWSFIKDANRIHAYYDIGDATEEMLEMNRLVEYYGKIRLVDGN